MPANRVKGYDPQCGDLARYFIGPQVRPELVQELAQHIQDSTEDWLQGEADKLGRTLAGMPEAGGTQ